MHKIVFTRHIAGDMSAAAGTYLRPVNGNQALINYKAAVRRSRNRFAFKVGAFQSGGRIGQTLQGVGSYLIPGDTSPVRSPIRSGVYGALTPGGAPGGAGGIGGVTKPDRGYRCPEGFQYGGRFTDNRFSTCGQMLFDIFQLGRTIGQIADGPGSQNGRLVSYSGGTEATPIRGLTPNDNQILIQRAAQIPRIGPANSKAKATAVQAASKALLNADDGVTAMVRRDGFGMRPIVSTAILRTVPDNRNMEGATFMTAVSDIGTIGKDELGLLSNTGVNELKYVMPNGVQLSLRKDRELTTGERRKLGRTVNAAASIDVSTDATARLRKVVEDSDGAISYTEDFAGIKDPNGFVDAKVGGATKRVRKWVYETFMKGRPKKTTRPSEDRTPAPAPGPRKRTERITSLAEAIKHLDAGGDPSQILPSLLATAMERSEKIRKERLNRFSSAYQRDDGTRFIETASQVDFEHLSARASADMMKALGLEAPTVYSPVGSKRASYIASDMEDSVGAGQIVPIRKFSDATPESVAKLALADWLLDIQERTPTATIGVKRGAKIDVASNLDRSALGTGIPKPQQTKRQELKIDEFFNARRASMYKEAFKKLSDSQRKSILRQLEEMTKRARAFSWEQYIERLMADGKLSAAEETHLQIMRGIYDARLSRLVKSKEQFAQIIGVIE